MATVESIADLRLKVAEPDNIAPYDDAALGLRLDQANGDVESVASDIWYEKAASYAELVDITEAGSSRKNSGLYKNAIEQAKFYGDAQASLDTGSYSTTRPIVRL